MKPLSPNSIDEQEDVLHSFQASIDFEKLHESSPEAAQSFENSEKFINSAASFLSKCGLGGLDRVTASGENSRFMMFSMHAEAAEPPGPRIFGITTKPEAKVQDVAFFVRGLL